MFTCHAHPHTAASAEAEAITEKCSPPAPSPNPANAVAPASQLPQVCVRLVCWFVGWSPWRSLLLTVVITSNDTCVDPTTCVCLLSVSPASCLPTTSLDTPRLQCTTFQARDCCGKGLSAGQQCGCTAGLSSFQGLQRLCLYSVVGANPTVVQTGVFESTRCRCPA